jgi:integrase
MLNGKAREMGLGSLLAVSLDDARVKANEARGHLSAKRDPIAVRDAEEKAKRLEAARALTFDQCAEAYIKAHRAGWRNAKYAAQWVSTLKTYVSPVFGKLPVQDVDETLVMKVLEPIWETKTETATRVRSRIELVLDWAKARKYRTGENPARWRGHLDHLLPRRLSVQPVRNHPALPYAEAAAFMMELRTRAGVAAKALEFAILTAARISEATLTQWDEINLEAGVWTLPASRMKSKREHRVPLSSAALKLLGGMKRQAGGYVFPGWRAKHPITSAACLKLLRDMRNDMTVHGFRSTFRDWAAECTNYPREVAEAALAHTIPDKTEAAYRRGDLFQKRARLMQAWADYLKKPAVRADVVPMKRKRKV